MNCPRKSGKLYFILHSIFFQKPEKIKPATPRHPWRRNYCWKLLFSLECDEKHALKGKMTLRFEYHYLFANYRAIH